MIVLPLILQAVAASTPAPAGAPAETLKSIEPALAIETFRTACWASFRDPAAFHSGVASAPVPLVPVARADGAPAPAGEVYHAPQAVLTYLASDTLAAGVPSRQCRLRFRLSGTADQLALAARLADALSLPTGRTRTDPAGSETSWDVPQPDGRIVRLIAATRNGVGGGSELRLAALLLSPR
jgi:hypothetical protein